MKETNMTALVSAFARAYHARADGPKVFDDPMAESLLAPGEFEKIFRSMSAGIQFFTPPFREARTRRCAGLSSISSPLLRLRESPLRRRPSKMRSGSARGNT